MQSELSPNRLLTRREVEAEFGISARYLEIHAVTGDGPPMIRISRSAVRYRVADIREWIEARRVRSTSEEIKGEPEEPGAGA